MQTIEGLFVKELHCKNDDCRALLGYERIKSGLLVFDCRHCKTTSVFRINYPVGQEMMDKLSDIEKLKGGEIENGTKRTERTNGSLLSDSRGD